MRQPGSGCGRSVRLPPWGSHREDPAIDEVTLISDGDGLAVIGDAAVVERFLSSEGLVATRAIDLPARSTLSLGSAAAQTASTVASSSGRWVKLTQESAGLIRKHGLRESASGLQTGVVKGSKGQIRTFVQFAKGPGTALTNPAVLAGAAGVMAQLAMKQSMDEITSYLARIDVKVEGILQAQQDLALSKVMGLWLTLDQALSFRDLGGRVDSITWSEIQSSGTTIADAQSYALRQLHGLIEKLETKTKVGELAEAAEAAEEQLRTWLAVLAHCWQLQDMFSVLKLDRVAEVEPGDIDLHRSVMQTARRDRIAVLSETTGRLITALNTAGATANGRVLSRPRKATEVVRVGNRVGAAVEEFHVELGLEGSWTPLTSRRWRQAVGDVTTAALGAGHDGVDAVRRAGVGAAGNVKAAGGGVVRRVGDRSFLRRDDRDIET